MQTHSSSIDTLKDNLLRAVDAEYNVIKPDLVLDIISQLEQMTITKDQLKTTRLGREINNIRQKIDARKKNIQSMEKTSELMIEIAHRAKKLLRLWQNLLNTTSSINTDTKPRLILKVKLNSSRIKRKQNSISHKHHQINIKRRKTSIIETNEILPHLKTTQELLLDMQRNESNILSTETETLNTILQKHILDDNFQYNYSTLHNESDLKQSPIIHSTSWSLSTNINESSSSIIEQSTYKKSDLSTICASFQTVADLVDNHRRRIFTEYDSHEIKARPDLLLVPIDQLAYVYEREKRRENDQSSSSSSLSQSSSITSVEKLSHLLALPFIDCPIEYNFILDEFIVQHPSIKL